MDWTHQFYKWWRHQMETFPRYWPFVLGIHRSPVNSPHKGQWRGALTFSFICAWINGWITNREAGDLRPTRAHYDVTALSEVGTVMLIPYYYFQVAVLHLTIEYPQMMLIGNKTAYGLQWVDINECMQIDSNDILYKRGSPEPILNLCHE